MIIRPRLCVINFAPPLLLLAWSCALTLLLRWRIKTCLALLLGIGTFCTFQAEFCSFQEFQIDYRSLSCLFHFVRDPNCDHKIFNKFIVLEYFTSLLSFLLTDTKSLTLWSCCKQLIAIENICLADCIDVPCFFCRSFRSRSSFSSLTVLIKSFS